MLWIVILLKRELMILKMGKRECMCKCIVVAWDKTVWLCSGTRWAARNRPSITRRRGRSANCTCSCTQAGARGTITVTAPRRRSERKSAHQSSREVLAHPNFSHYFHFVDAPPSSAKRGRVRTTDAIGEKSWFHFFFFCFLVALLTHLPREKLTTCTRWSV